jgi:2-polyprenyl-3-methyl-5-hydroxy-6-metoxy-1,4-benzoquinol methylase
MYSRNSRERKAKTMIAVLGDYYKKELQSLTLLDIGASTGIIDNYLSEYFGKVIGTDIDKSAIQFANDQYRKKNLKFIIGDGVNICFNDNSFDVIICSQVYEHVPDANKLLSEIHRTLKPNGVCYFAASNRMNIHEPHYNLPFLSIIPRPLSHAYLRVLRKGNFYYEKHLSYFGLKSIVRNFQIIDYTKKIIFNPKYFHVEYMIRESSLKYKLAKFMVKYMYVLLPGYIWILRK